MASSSVDKLQQFVNQQAHYQQRWARHDTAFWLKFVIREWTPLTTSLLDRVTNLDNMLVELLKWTPLTTSCQNDMSCRLCKNSNLHLDYIYVDLLKLVLGKKFGKLHKYVSDVLQLLQADGELSSQDGKLLEGLFGANCKEAAPWWLNLCLALHVEACEALLELLDAEEPLLMLEVPQVWSKPAEHARPFEAFLRSRWGEELPDLLTVPMNELSWWTKPMAASKPPARNYPTPRGYWVCPRGPEGVESWLQRYQPPVTQGTYTKGPPLEGIKKLLWQVLELSIPPVWSRKFHLCDSWQLTKGLTNFEALDSCPWIVTWLQAFDLSYMRVLHEASGDVIFTSHVKTLKSMLALPNAPRDLETQADFLLEPTLLLQLPWSAALFQQWLAGALLEVTRFEALSMELRHWPMDQDVLPAASRLLGLVARCKERLLLGLALLTRDIKEFPAIKPDVPSIILNKVVMPAVSVLRFLLHGQAYPILQQLKQRAFSQNSDLTTFPESHVCVNPRTYHIDPRLLHFHVTHYFHVFYWMRDPQPQPFSISDSLRLKAWLPDYMTCSVSSCDGESPIHFEPISSEVFRKACQTNNADIFVAICNPFILNMFGDKAAALIGKGNNTKAMEISPSNRDEARERRASMLRHSSLFTEVGEFATRVRAEPPSLLGCLVASTAEALVREHEVRCDLLDALIRDKPVHVPPSAGQDPPFDLEQIHAALHQATEKYVLARKEDLDEQLPMQWLGCQITEDALRDFFKIQMSKKLFCQKFDMFSGRILINYFSSLEKYKYRLETDHVLVHTYLGFALSLRFSNRALQSVENNKETTVEQKLARKFVTETFAHQSLCVLPSRKNVKPCTTRKQHYLTRIKTCRAIVRTFTLRQDNSTNLLLGLASKCGVSVDSHVQSMREWLNCIDELSPHNQANILLCVAAEHTYYVSRRPEEFSCRDTLKIEHEFSLKENELQRLMGIRLIMDTLVNILAALAEKNPLIKNLKHAQLLLHIQPTLLKIKTAQASYFITIYHASEEYPAIPFERIKFMSQISTLYSQILELVLAIRRTIPGDLETPFESFVVCTDSSFDILDIFCGLKYSRTGRAKIFKRLGLLPSSLKKAEEYLEKLSSIVEAQEGEETLDLDPECFFNIRACACCEKLKDKDLGLVKEEVFFCSARCADATQESAAEEGHWEENDGEEAQIRVRERKVGTLNGYQHGFKNGREERVKERRCEQCDVVETAKRTFYKKKFCTKKCQDQWRETHEECLCCEKVAPEPWCGETAMKLCSFLFFCFLFFFVYLLFYFLF